MLEETLSRLSQEGYTHVIGLFLSSGISGFFQNIQYLKEEFSKLCDDIFCSQLVCVDSKYKQICEYVSEKFGVQVEYAIN